MKYNRISFWMICALLSVPTFAGEARIVRESTEWCDVWVTNADKSDLPRVLLIGDSITRGYGAQVESKLKGKAYVGRLATSKSLGDPALLQEVITVLEQYKFDLVHFNNGMHGWGYTEEEYGKAFPELITTIRQHAPKAKLIWATTTPVRVHNKLEELDPRTDRVKARNKIAAGYVEKEKIPTDDLFSLVLTHPDYHSADGVHFATKGIAAQAEQVAESILKCLP